MKAEQEIFLPLSESNFGHVLAALALAGVAEESSSCCETRCWWNEMGFVFQTSIDKSELFALADSMLRELEWIEGLGVDEKFRIVSKAHNGVIMCGNRFGINPFLSFLAQGKESSPMKTFAGQLTPKKVLESQLRQLTSPAIASDWLFQRAFGVGSWGFDPSVGSHAYDLGFSSNDEGSGNADPIYPAIELLSLAGAGLYSTPHAWQTNDESIGYVIWREPLASGLARLAAGGRVEGVKHSTYTLATRGAAYGKGASYRYFPEASKIN